MRWGVWLLALMASFVVTSSAAAGTYVVRACGTSAGLVPNRSWTYGSSQWFNAYGTCAKPGDAIGTHIWPNGTAISPGSSSALVFTAPPETSIADFRFDRNVYFYNPTVPEAPRSPYVLFELGTTPFAGAGDLPAREQVNAAAPSQWYGYPSGAADTGQAWMALKDFPALRGYRGGAGVLRVSIGCAPGGAACSLRPDGWVLARLFGAEVTVDDRRRPVVSSTAVVQDGVTFSASDNAGIRTVTLLDATGAGAPIPVASRDYRHTRSGEGDLCDAARPQPCPTELRDERLTGMVGTGRRSLILRVEDVAGNVTETDPSVVQVGSPATSCAPGGSLVNARLAPHRRVRFGRRAALAGRVRAADGTTPLAGAAVQAYTRVLRRGSGWTPAGTATSGARGRFRIRVEKGPSRAVRVALVEGAVVRCSRTLRLRVRAGVTLRIDRRSVARSGRVRFAGRLRGGPARRGRLVIVQAFDGGRWRTFASARTGRRGRWAARYRFSGSASGTFRFRARVRSQAGYPYATGTSRVKTVRVG